MLFHGQTNTVSIAVDMEKVYLDNIWSVFGLVKVYGNRFICSVFHTTPLFTQAFCQCVTGLANVLAGKGGVLFMQHLQLIK